MEKKVEITGLAFGGKGLGRIDGKVVFVPFTAPGDEALVRITSDKKSFSEGELVEVLKPSGLRRKPECPLFGRCGGCSLQHMNYDAQVEWKERIFEETLKRIGKVEGISFDVPLPSPKPFNYRSRARFQIYKKKWGFFETESHRVVDVEDCPILDPVVNKTFKEIKNRMAGENPALYSLEIGVSEDDGKAVAAFHIDSKIEYDWQKALTGIEGLKGFEVRLSPLKDKGKLLLSEGDLRLGYGIDGFKFTAGVSVFSQVNRFQNRNIIGKVIEYAGLKGDEHVIDLFSGVGNLSLPLAGGCKKITGVEASMEAVEDARKNASRNAIRNAEWFPEYADNWLKQNIKNLENGNSLVVVLDPPRGGEPEVAKALSELLPKKIIYVSCSPPTLARDISLLAGRGYRVFRAGLFDMFPQTFHIESIVGLEI